MVTLRVIAVAFVLLALFGGTLYRGANEVVTAKTKAQRARGDTTENKFLGQWSSQITRPSGEKVDDGKFNIANVSPASSDKVSVLHSLRGGPFTGYTIPYPDRIEIRMSLGEGQVIHYNGVLEAADRVEGRYFKTDERQRNHSRKRSAANQVSASLQEDEGTWVLTKP